MIVEISLPILSNAIYAKIVRLMDKQIGRQIEKQIDTLENKMIDQIIRQIRVWKNWWIDRSDKYIDSIQME